MSRFVDAEWIIHEYKVIDTVKIMHLCGGKSGVDRPENKNKFPWPVKKMEDGVVQCVVCNKKAPDHIVIYFK